MRHPPVLPRLLPKPADRKPYFCFRGLQACLHRT
mgnify:CR=1 FL=1